MGTRLVAKTAQLYCKRLVTSSTNGRDGVKGRGADRYSDLVLKGMSITLPIHATS